MQRATVSMPALIRHCSLFRRILVFEARVSSNARWNVCVRSTCTRSHVVGPCVGSVRMGQLVSSRYVCFGHVLRLLSLSLARFFLFPRFGHRRATCAPRFVSRSLVPSCVASFSFRLRRGRTKVGSRLLRSILPIRLRLRCLVPSLPMAMSSVPCRSCPSRRTNHVQTLRPTHPSPWEFLLPSGREVDQDEREKQARGWADEDGRTDARSAKKEDGTGGSTDVPYCTAVSRLVRPSLDHVGRIRFETNRPTSPGLPCLPPCNKWACFYQLAKDRPQEERAATKENTEPTCTNGASKCMSRKTKLADPFVKKHSQP